MIRVLTYGTFDLFHHGHVRLLRRLRDLGDHLVVGCSTDEFNAAKGKTTIIPYAERVEVLAACRYVDEVIPEYCWDQKSVDIQTLRVDILGMGDDWQGKFDDMGAYARVVYLPRTPEISTTAIKHETIRRVA